MQRAGEKRPANWTPQEDDRLLDICGERRVIAKTEWQQILESFPGRTVLGLRQRYLVLRNRKNGIGDYGRATRVQIFERRKAQMQEPVIPAAMPEHATITAALFGDPLPGRSALDKRNAGMSA